MNHARVIADLGGAPRIAERLGCHVSRPYRWMDDGIPPQRWRALAALALELKQPGITLETLAAGWPRKGIP